MILATKDAVSLPWPIVCDAWAVSMHTVEDGRLGWEDTNQWSFNSLGRLRLRYEIVKPLLNQIGRFVDIITRGSCSHENHHGSYSHFCSVCTEQGRSLPHPESKWNFKV